MTRIYNDPSAFKEEVMEGVVTAYPRYVERVPRAAGFVRRGGTRDGKVSLVIGGGSGHYPSYSGVTGYGFADGCVLGDVFTSPSTEQVYRIARAADGGAGVLLSFGNYAGDRLNFGAARERLLSEGIDTRIVYVTDDVASAPSDEADKRRGIAGTFTVYKIGGAAAERGADLDTVERVMRAANAATFSFGVAFAGCTLPGSREPLFRVAPGQTEFGLGIHGEPGIRTEPSMPARELAGALVSSVLEERPVGTSGRAAVLLNGLGATKYEELFVLYGHAARLLSEAGVEPVLPEVGELVTSLDMAGCSLSITWLDEELEEYWTAPTDTPAFRRGSVPVEPVTNARRRVADAAETAAEATAASELSVAAAAVARRCVAAMADVVVANQERLGQIDAVAGDGDHGLGMSRGLLAARDIADTTDARAGVGTLLQRVGAEFGDKAGGTSGVLWGILLSAAGSCLGDSEPVDAQRVAVAARQGADALQRAGGAQLGDKTMLDALLPFVGDLEGQLAAGTSLAPAWEAAAATATTAADATAALKPRMGRARPLAERSIGTPDAGAISMALILTAVGEVLRTEDCAH
jgi:dihydroxyacetone kinase